MNPTQTIKALNVAENFQIADFGCGSGYFTIPLAKVAHEGKIFAIDILEGPLQHIRSRAKLENLHNIKTIRANLETPNATGLQDESQDLVIMSNILFQAENHVNILKEAYRVLKSKRFLAIIEWKKNQAPIEIGRYINKEKVIEFVKAVGFKLLKELEAGSSHYALVFEKK
jgi:ubiquinone/menaquinone biosynthesis C-methylase UbiE